MGELVLTTQQLHDLNTQSGDPDNYHAAVGATTTDKTSNDGASKALLKWERFLSRMAFRVLLVEADDSTRQIIAALLRKCRYRVVAVPDGLKAWEILKGQAHNFDLILTEVDLPSISGFALLTLIMEHEICKNIPVIMMSSQDSINTVYKCMLRGGADYLVKPIRRNELRNMWQHVWKRQSSISGGSTQRDESVGQQNVEVNSENNSASNHSSGYMACVQRNKEQTEKGSDAQSSCTKPDFEAESTHVEEKQEPSLLMRGKPLLSELQKHETEANFTNESGTGVLGACKDSYTTNIYKGVELEGERRDATISSKDCDTVVDSSRGAIDFMGAFNNQYSSSISIKNNFDFTLGLDLSLRRSHSNSLENHITQERPTLWHPNASAFTRYNSKSSQTLHSAPTSASDQKRESGTNSPSPTLTTQRSMISLATDKSKQSEISASYPQRSVFPVPVQLKGMRLNSLCAVYNSVIPPMVFTQSSVSPTPSPSSANQQEYVFNVNPCSNSGRLHDQLDANHSTNQPLRKLDKQLDCFEERGHISPTTDQSASSSFCNGATSHANGIGYGSTCASNQNVDQLVVARASENEDVFLSPSGNSHRSIQREAALTKFRLKRKDRCYEKKVRYESRKKLAEQRPRVKGQFVRQA